MKWHELNYWLGLILTVYCFYYPSLLNVWELLCAVFKDLYIYILQLHSCMVNINICDKNYTVVLIYRMSQMFIIKIIVRVWFYFYVLSFWGHTNFIFDITTVPILFFPQNFYSLYNCMTARSCWVSVISELNSINNNDHWKLNLDYQYFDS